MINRFIYIDDEDESIAIRDGLNDTGLIEVQLEKPESFENQTEKILQHLSGFDGLILDFRLDDHPKSNAKYTAPPLAQSLRSITAIDKKSKDCPIILCSTDSKIKSSYIGEQSSHDLFDYKFLKDHSPNWKLIAHKLASLANGYRHLNEKRLDISGIINRNVTDVDNRVFEKFANGEIVFPPHEYARYIVKEVIGNPGPLIDEYFLAARLGLDIEQSTDWPQLKAAFHETKYTGLFSDGWERWWSDLVISRFKTLTTKRLASIGAQERVEQLKKALGLPNLTSAKPINRCVSESFWTICEYYKRPLDPLEGFKILTTKDTLTWQEHRYLSIDAAVERKGINQGLHVHPSENTRLENIKTQLRQQAK